MYKTSSKFLQGRQVSPDWLESAATGRERRREAAATRRREAAEEANERRAPFFYSIKKLSSGAKSDLPGWLQVEIRKVGSTKGWIKKNAYWQKRLRQQYYSVIAATPELRGLKDSVPGWLFEEVSSFGRAHWLNVHAARQKVEGGEKDPRTDQKEVKRENKYAVLSHGEEKSGFSLLKDALDDALSGGAFDSNRRRH